MNQKEEAFSKWLAAAPVAAEVQGAILRRAGKRCLFVVTDRMGHRPADRASVFVDGGGHTFWRLLGNGSWECVERGDEVLPVDSDGADKSAVAPFRVIRDRDEYDLIGGGSRTDEIGCTYKELVAAIGEPSSRNHRGRDGFWDDPRKVDVVWGVKSGDGKEWVSIWNYKNGPAYNGGRASMRDINYFSVDASNGEALLQIIRDRIKEVRAAG